jgi:hypothetical protein
VAFGEVLGLVVRRHGALWLTWRPWVALVFAVAPLGVLLSFTVTRWAEISAVYAWLYVNNWTWAFVTVPGARRDLLYYATSFCLDYLTLMGWSWTTGFVVGSLSGRAVRVSGMLWCVVLIGAFVATPPHRQGANAAVFALIVYDKVLPVLLLMVLVAWPAVSGMYTSVRTATLSPLQATLLAMAIATLTARRIDRLPFHQDGQLWWVPLVVMWPVTFMLVTAHWRRWRRDGTPHHSF